MVRHADHGSNASASDGGAEVAELKVVQILVLGCRWRCALRERALAGCDLCGCAKTEDDQRCECEAKKDLGAHNAPAECAMLGSSCGKSIVRGFISSRVRGLACEESGIQLFVIGAGRGGRTPTRGKPRRILSFSATKPLVVPLLSLTFCNP